MKLSDALSIVRQTLSPDIVKQKGSVELKIGRSNPTQTNSQNASKSSKTDQKLPLVGDLLPSKAPAPIPKKESTQPRHNDSYIMATQFGIKKIPIDPKINRSQSLKALQYINGQSTEDSVIYKGNVLRIAQSFKSICVGWSVNRKLVTILSTALRYSWKTHPNMDEYVFSRNHFHNFLNSAGL